MSSRNIAVREDVYIELQRRKGSGESFTEVIVRLLERKGRPSDAAGGGDDLSPKEEEALSRGREELRASWSGRLGPEG